MYFSDKRRRTVCILLSFEGIGFSGMHVHKESHGCR